MKKLFSGLFLILPLLCPAQEAVFWKVADLPSKYAGSIEVLGTPHNVPTPLGDAVFFDGDGDGFYLNFNPLEGMEYFTVEVVFRPDADGPRTPRFMNFGTPSGRRILFETRINHRREWYFDVHFNSGEGRAQGRTLIDSTLTHPSDRWYTVTMVNYRDGMSSYVDGVLQLAGAIESEPLPGGGLSIGYRQNRSNWFKGSIYAIRITPRILRPDEFLKLHKKLNR